jgi:hypothetical protein
MYKSVTLKCRLCYIDCLGFKWWWSTINQTSPHHQQSPLTTPLPSHIFINLLWQGKLNWTLTWACLAYMVKNIYWTIRRKASKYHRSGQERFKCKKLTDDRHQVMAKVHMTFWPSEPKIPMIDMFLPDQDKMWKLCWGSQKHQYCKVCFKLTQ